MSEKKAIDEIKGMASAHFHTAINTMITIWNNGITINGIIIGACAVILALNTAINTELILLIIGLSIISIIFLISNFYIMKSACFEINDELTKYIDAYIEKKGGIHRIKLSSIGDKIAITKYFEIIVIVIFVVQLIIGAFALKNNPEKQVNTDDAYSEITKKR